MGFSGLEERFLAKAKQEYNKFSTRDGAPGGGQNEQPFIEIKPDDPSAGETTHDTFTLPIGSTKRDIKRLGAYLKSGEGQVFLVRQGFLQLSNAFSESRTLNPLFVIGNAVPFLHLKRPLTGQADFAPRGNSQHASMAALDPKIEGAGRLQKTTAKQVVGNVMGKSGASGLMGILSNSQIISGITGIFALGDFGSLGVDERPELNVGTDKWFSIAMWKGYSKKYGFNDSLKSAKANLRVGNIQGAVRAINRGVTGEIQSAASTVASLVGRGGVLPLTKLPSDGRDRAQDGFEGRRYFIINPTDADRYLRGSIHFEQNSEGQDTPHVNTPYLNRRPYSEVANRAKKKSIDQFIEVKPNFNLDVSLSDFGLGSALGEAGKDIGRVASSVGRSIATAATKLSNSVRQAIPTFPVSMNVKSPVSVTLHEDAIRQMIEQPPAIDLENNPAEQAMLFNRLSLHQRYYSDERMDAIRAAIQAQKDASFAYWALPENSSDIGIESDSKYKAGRQTETDPVARTGVRRYFSDRMNRVGVIDQGGGTSISDTTLKKINSELGRDLINVLFFDVVNKKVVPFRAFITDIHESTTPEFNDRRYIGRIERNVVYVGVNREISFRLMVHAFNVDEMERIWSKLNYLTGLCYPADYDTGFMVPPMVKLTIGDVFRDQPGYIRTISNTIENNTSWDIRGADSLQAPHGVTLQVTFAVIEKKQMKTGSEFYSFGKPRTITNETE